MNLCTKNIGENIYPIKKNILISIILGAQNWASSSSSVSITFEEEPQLEDAILELAFVAMFPADFPFPVHNFECNVPIGWTSTETDDRKIGVLASGECECWSVRGIQQIRIENLQIG